MRPLLRRRTLAWAAALFGVALAVAGPAGAQYGRTGGQGRPQGGRGPPRGPSRTRSAPPPARRPEPTADVVGVGVIRSIDATAGRVTIGYESIEALGWPAGAMRFAVSRASLLDGRTVGEKVRFRLESQQIADLQPFAPPLRAAPAPAAEPDPAAAREAAALAGAVIARPRR